MTDVMDRRVLIARCTNVDEWSDQPCTGHLRYRWGQSGGSCDTCGGFCGISVAVWERVEVAADGSAAPPLDEHGTVPLSHFPALAKSGRGVAGKIKGFTHEPTAGEMGLCGPRLRVDERSAQAVATDRLRELWATGDPAARGSLRAEGGRWPSLAAALDVLAEVTPPVRRADATAFAAWDAREHDDVAALWSRDGLQETAAKRSLRLVWPELAKRLDALADGQEPSC